MTVKVHKAGIRALAFGSTGHRFIFSAADDRQLICTDIEVNKVCYLRWILISACKQPDIIIFCLQIDRVASKNNIIGKSWIFLKSWIAL